MAEGVVSSAEDSKANEDLAVGQRHFAPEHCFLVLWRGMQRLGKAAH